MGSLVFVSHLMGATSGLGEFMTATLLVLLFTDTAAAGDAAFSFPFASVVSSTISHPSTSFCSFSFSSSAAINLVYRNCLFSFQLRLFSETNTYPLYLLLLRRSKSLKLENDEIFDIVKICVHNTIAVAPLAHKSRHTSESRDEMRSERRASASGSMNLPAYNNYLIRHSGEERLVDGPIDSVSDGRIAYLEKRIRELEMVQKEQNSQAAQNQSRYSKPTHINGNNMSTSEQLRLQEMNDELVNKDRKVTSLEAKLLKAYQRIEKINEDYESKIKTLIFDGEHARDNLTRCVDKIQQLENELDVTRAVAQKGDSANEQEYHELRDKIWMQERELQENRTMLTRLREKEAEYERMRSEKGYLELKNENLNKKLEAKKRVVEELERSVSTLRLEQTICQQSCSSGSTPLADEMETMSEIRPSIARPYTKAHSTLGSHMSPLSHSKSSGLTKSVSSFGLNTAKRDDVTPMMSRTIREQDRHITMCRAMVVCLKDTVDRMARGENPDVARLLGVKLNMMSESEMDEDEDYEADESKPFSMMAAESALSKQCTKLADLDRDIDTIRCQLADWHGQTNIEGEGDRDVCRVQ
uniref:Uncharacterized protein n=2 Tax=Caenorhabditis japonica TaxID=281687 RepID=A0A8R1DLZ2_CAEJA